MWQFQQIFDDHLSPPKRSSKHIFLKKKIISKADIVRKVILL